MVAYGGSDDVAPSTAAAAPAGALQSMLVLGLLSGPPALGPVQPLVVALRHRVDDGDHEVDHHDDDDLLEDGRQQALGARRGALPGFPV